MNAAQKTALIAGAAVVLVVLVGVSAFVGYAGSAWLYHRVTRAPASTTHTVTSPTRAAAVLLSREASPSLLAVLSAGQASTDGSSATSGTSDTSAQTGPEGPAGADGAAGLDGAPGADGAAGPEGPVGPEGPAGPQGSVGTTGPAGPEGSVGATGPAGLGLTATTDDGGGFELVSPDGKSYRIDVTNAGIWFDGPTTHEVWTETSHFEPLPY